ncbi:MAG: sulfatase-like hydrolase/transferase [Bacteroidetes bacterium]|nr:sulfatase-like hydrolase/transferase [Bacteroidota bacterium]
MIAFLLAQSSHAQLIELRAQQRNDQKIGLDWFFKGESISTALERRENVAGAVYEKIADINLSDESYVDDFNANPNSGYIYRLSYNGEVYQTSAKTYDFSVFELLPPRKVFYYRLDGRIHLFWTDVSHVEDSFLVLDESSNVLDSVGINETHVVLEDEGWEEIYVAARGNGGQTDNVLATLIEPIDFESELIDEEPLVAVCPNWAYINGVSDFDNVDINVNGFIDYLIQDSSLRNEIDVLKFYSQIHFMNQESLRKIVDFQQRYDKMIAIEVGGIRQRNGVDKAQIGETMGAHTIEHQILPIVNAGGTVDYIETDNAILFSIYGGKEPNEWITTPLNLTASEVATELADFFEYVHQRYPEMKFGAIENLRVNHFGAWKGARNPLGSSLEGLKDILFQLNVHMRSKGLRLHYFNPEASAQDMDFGFDDYKYKELLAVSDYCNSLGIKLAKLYNPAGSIPSSKEFVNSTVQFYVKAKEEYKLNTSMDVFQSWIAFPTSIYGNNDPYSFANMLKTILLDELPGPSSSMNVLMIMTDQHTFSALGASGNEQIHTPNLDRLRSDGTFFTHCMAPTPDCSPARASILTGLATHRHGIWNNVDQDAGLPGLDDGVFPVTGELLYNVGYNTLQWGKLHVCNTNTRPKDYITSPWSNNTDFTCYEHWPFELSGKRDAALAGLDEAAFNRGYPDWDNWNNPEHVDHIPVINQAMSSYVKDIGRSPVPAIYTREFAFGEELMEAMDIYRDYPWMFTLSYNPPHKPWIVPDPYYGMYDPDSLVLPANQDVVFSDALASAVSAVGGKEIREKGRREFLRTYYGQISMVDEMVGKVLDRLDSLGLRERTLVVFTSDHGDMAASHGAVGHHIPAFFEPQIRVPLIVSCPGRIPGGTVVDELVTPMDLMPTILDYTGHADLVPQGIDGSSLRPLMEGDTVVWREHVTGMRDVPGEAPNTQYMIRNERWKYWWNFSEDLVPHLYDLETDPLEKNNLAANPEYYDTLMVLHNALTDWVKEEQAIQHEVMEYMEPIVGMEIKPLAMTLHIYPNPASERFTLHFSSEHTGEVAMRVFDISGRLMRSDRLDIAVPGPQEYSGIVAGLSSGTYYIQLESETSVATGKLIVNTNL